MAYVTYGDDNVANPANPSVDFVNVGLGTRDSRKSDVAQFVGTGEETLFSLGKTNVFGVLVTINSTEVPTADYTLNSEAGKVIFQTAPLEDANIVVTYYYAGYTDDQFYKK